METFPVPALCDDDDRDDMMTTMMTMVVPHLCLVVFVCVSALLDSWEALMASYTYLNTHHVTCLESDAFLTCGHSLTQASGPSVTAQEEN